MIVSFHRLLPKEIVKDEDIPLKGTCLRDKANKTKSVRQWLVLQIVNCYRTVCRKGLGSLSQGLKPA
jgi:hypothetical protein